MGAGPPPANALALAAAALLEGVADMEGRGLLLRGASAPLRLADLEPGTPLRAAAEGVLRLAAVGQEAADLLRDHPDQAVRRAAALLAAHAHPLRAGLEATSPPADGGP